MKKGGIFSYFKPLQGASSKQSPLPKTNGSSDKASSPPRSNGDGGATQCYTSPADVGDRKRARDNSANSDEDSDNEIGVKKSKSGRPKRQAALSRAERARAASRSTKRKELESSDEEETYCPGSGQEAESSEGSSGNDDDESHTPPAKIPKRKLNKSLLKTPVTPATTVRKSFSFTPKSTPTPSTPSTPLTPLTPFTPSQHKHEKLDWLKEENRRDKNGRCMSDPDYNPRTIKVPQDFLKKLTPGVRQWWEIKIDNFDTIIAFKVGKFYEFYHMDAEIGVRELGLTFMKGEFAHSGFPEIAFDRYAQTLVQKGYKVARVEQTETPQMMEQRLQTMRGAPTKFDRVVRREVCSVVSKGTRTLTFLDNDVIAGDSAYLLAVKEKSLGPGESEYGVCFVDTRIGLFHIGQFSDDRQSSRLRTLVAHYPPAQVLYPRGSLSTKTLQIINQQLATSIRDCLAPNTEFWDSGKTLKMLSESGYFTEDENDTSTNWPDTLKALLAEDDGLGLTSSEAGELALSCLGAVVWCLRKCCIDHQLMALASFKWYEPLDVASGMVPTSAGDCVFAGQKMILDDITLANLDVLDSGGTQAGTLLAELSHCVTSFGGRRLKEWLCAPLCHPAAINERLDAVTELVGNAALMGEVRDVLRTLPDLERLLRKIHTMGSVSRSKDHPDGRAIFYEDTTYSKRKITDFLSVLDGFQASLRVLTTFDPVRGGLESPLLRRLVTRTQEGGTFPDLEEKLSFFQNSFDQAKAGQEGVIIPSAGVCKDYDLAQSCILATKNRLDDYLDKQRKRLTCKGIVFWGSGRNRYQLTVPEATLAKYTPDDYELKSQKKGFRRYWTREIEALLEQLTSAEERRGVALRDTMRQLFHAFAEHFKLWESAVHCLGSLDAIMCLATYSCEGGMCRPTVSMATAPYLRIVSGRHPCVTSTYTGDDFIPNDVIINCEGGEGGCVVVTGPNMGGKSTLMRQTGLIVILTHLGCYVPAEQCSLSPVDRVFTRLGASDRIMAGESTFFVELSETATILQHATKHSMVLLDELGRGTATYDGTAIACAVVRELAEGISCRTLFSTHYHSLVEEFSTNTHIQLGHMACMVESEDCDGEESLKEETITFLYKFVGGACPKSYGFNAARLAGLPLEVIRVARKKAQEFEQSTEEVKLFRKLITSGLDANSVEVLRNQIAY